MSYIALYRKYRPKTFDEVYGQPAIVQTLKNQITSNRIGHAYLFSGPRGTGKTSISKIFAKAINCKSPVNGSPCGTCECCQTFANGLNVDIVEIDAASNNGVDNIRDLIEESKYMPQYGQYKVYIIDEVHMLSSSAFNALLKTLEEPSQNVVFILATTEEHKVPPTIYSRCQRHQFKLIKDNDIVDSLKDILVKENIEWEDDALVHVAKLAKGGLRDALSLLDHCTTFTSGKITLDLVMEVFGEVQDSTILAITECISKRDIPKLFDIIAEQYQCGKTLSNICLDLYEYYKEEYFNNPNIDTIVYERYMKILAELSEKMKYNSNRTVFEIEMIKLCTPQMQTDYSALHERIQQLESMVQQITTNPGVYKNTHISESYDESEFVTCYVGVPRKVSTEIYYI